MTAPVSHGSHPVSRGKRAVALTAALVLGMAGIGVFAAETSPLREHLSLKREALGRQQDAGVSKVHARITAESRSGVRRLRIRDFQFLSDSDRDYAGYSLGPGSWDSLVGVLASAVAEEYLIQAAAREIPLDSLDVIFTSHPDEPSVESKRTVRYPRNLSYVAHIDSPATDAQLEALRTSVEKISPVLSLVAESQPVGHGEIVLTPSPAKRDPGLPPGLRDFLVEKSAAIERRERRPQQSSYALRAHARVEPRTGIRQVRTGEFQFLNDSPTSFAGYGIAPTVEEHVIGVLGTCLTHIYEVQAATRHVVLDSLELRFEAELTPRNGSGEKEPPRFRDVRYSVHIESPAPKDQIEQLRNAVEATCPVYNLIKDAQTIRGHIERGRYKPPPVS